MALIGAVAEENIKVKTEPKYEIKTKFKIALTAHSCVWTTRK